MSVGRTFVAAVGHRPDLVVLVHDQRGGLDAHGDLVADLVGFGVDHQDSVLVRPAVGEDVFVVLHHLFSRTGFEIHIRFDIAGDLVGLGIDDVDARIPDLGDVGFFVAQEMDVAGRSEARDASHLLEGVDVDRIDHARVVHYDPTDTVADDHRLRDVAQLDGVGSGENFILDMFFLRIVIGERGIAVHEIPFVGDEEPLAGHFVARTYVVDFEILFLYRSVIHARHGQRRACTDYDSSFQPIEHKSICLSIRPRNGRRNPRLPDSLSSGRSSKTPGHRSAIRHRHGRRSAYRSICRPITVRSSGVRPCSRR